MEGMVFPSSLSLEEMYCFIFKILYLYLNEHLRNVSYVPNSMVGLGMQGLKYTVVEFKFLVF